MEWVSIEDKLPEEAEKYTQVFVDVWSNNNRLVDVNFFDGEFHSMIGDYQGDFSHFEVIDNVTHWLSPESPKEANNETTN